MKVEDFYFLWESYFFFVEISILSQIMCLIFTHL